MPRLIRPTLDHSGATALLSGLALPQLIDLAGPFPQREGDGPAGNVLAMVHSFAAAGLAFGAAPCAGQQVPIPQNQPLMAVIGLAYGGGSMRLGLPDLRRRVAVGGNPGTLGGQSLAMTWMVAAGGASGQPAPFPMLGAIGLFAGNYAPAGWLPADGSLLRISQNVPLFELIGTAFGGNGASTFALPNLAGRAPVGIGEGPGLPPAALGQALDGQSGGPAGLGLNYLVNVAGAAPPIGGNGGFPPSASLLAEVVAFAGAAPPSGWAAADGRLLVIADNRSLFELIGTTYGGDGQENFALPDLRGRMIVGQD